MPIDFGHQLIARWLDPDPAHAALLKQAGIEVVLLGAPHAAFERAVADAGFATSPVESAGTVVTRGLWPGIRDAARQRGGGDETASASREPWVDANGYLVAVERALNPGRTPVLGYLPDAKAGVTAQRMIPFETLEIALVEARMNGGNFLLAVEPRYRAALLRKDARALAAWESLGRMSKWLSEHAALFGRPANPVITALVEPGPATSELANLLFRRNGSPLIAAAADPPAPGRAQCLVASSLKSLTPDQRKRVFAHAEAGATVVIDSAPERWKLARQERDRDFYSVGKGHVLAYHKRIVDPSEFALDCIDVVSHRHRAARLWNANSVIALSTEGTKPGEQLLLLINYGSAVNEEVQARVAGHFGSAELIAPGAAARPLKTARRGTTTEVFLPALGRCAVVRFA
ncbi:MAG: hypothetical protein FJW39_04080 [Acidobacteria bacterium]|nr:hypothetical protein [Acidobacteriota bacterium]